MSRTGTNQSPFTWSAGQSQWGRTGFYTLTAVVCVCWWGVQEGTDLIGPSPVIKGFPFKRLNCRNLQFVDGWLVNSFTCTTTQTPYTPTPSHTHTLTHTLILCIVSTLYRHNAFLSINYYKCPLTLIWPSCNVQLQTKSKNNLPPFILSLLAMSPQV